MHLKRLELFGFKSFAKQTALEFPSSITAIVGPNGSGKSNIREAIQWAFGEQSMKSLRGKRGEDLIWNGSHTLPRMGKASVALAFDNAGGKIPVAFGEVLIQRSIFRDGAGEYGLNGSIARLRDIEEIAAHLGIGESKHNIIGQGEVDRMLAAPPGARRAMLEDALGLRVHQLKKEEAERKLAATRENMKRVEVLLRELAPHATLLRSQAKKAEARDRLLKELRVSEKTYLAREKKEIAEVRARIDSEKKPLAARARVFKKNIDALTKALFDAEARIAAQEQEKQNNKTAQALDAQKRELEHELSRLEGKIEAGGARMQSPSVHVVDMHYVKTGLHAFLKKMRDAIESPRDFNLSMLVSDLEQFLAHIEKGAIQQKPDAELLRQKKLWEERARILREQIQDLSQALKKEQEREKEAHDSFHAARARIRDCDSQLRMAQDAERELRFQLERFTFEEERVAIRAEAFARELDACGMRTEELEEAHGADHNRDQGELKKTIDRMRAHIEAIGTIDQAILSEFQETEARISFLTKELEDITHASQSLASVVRTLAREMDRIFRSGFEKMKEEFRNFFRIIFGGGEAELVLVRPARVQKNNQSEFSDSHAAEEEAGIEISVDIPRKRIRGLAMLSGGERALTSIAFLFAVASVNPPPFLVLDETDAAFDEANSRRYGAILKELVKRTQLILITHNRETMKTADVLYGITTGDDGASKLLSLKFAEAEGYASR